MGYKVSYDGYYCEVIISLLTLFFISAAYMLFLHHERRVKFWIVNDILLAAGHNRMHIRLVLVTKVKHHVRSGCFPVSLQDAKQML